MGRRRRKIISNKAYEVSCRTIEGLPFVATFYMKLIMESVLARALEIHPVILCHLVWMGNHPHMLLIAKDATQCKNFYGYVQKQLTESIKRLLRLEYLSLWQGRPMVARVGDLEEAKKRLVYFFNNPTKANLVDKIEQYNQINTWDTLMNSDKKVDTVVTKQVPYVRLPMIPKLPCYSMSEVQDKAFTKNIRAKTKKTHALTYHPYLWLKCFDACENSDSAFIQEVIDDISRVVKENEDSLRQARIEAGKKVIGAKRLALQDIRQAHTPKKFAERKVFVLASDPKLRIQLIKEHNEFCEDCRLAYLDWKVGDFSVDWPMGAFKPPLPPTENVLY